jgi:glucan 1,3-beta-glucosidase
MGTTGQPAIVYLPAGTYNMAQSLQLYRGTVLLGDATQLPTLKAVANFPNDHIIYGKDPHQPGTNNFMIAIKNIVLDSNNVDPASQITLLDWTVSQATQLTNVIFEMPNFSTGHKGLTTQYNTPEAGNSNIIMNDLTFNGGVIGMDVNGQQWLFKGVNFNRCTTGMKITSSFNVVVSASTFTDCSTGIDATGASGSLTLLDSDGSNLDALVRSSNSDPAGHFIILENVKSGGKTVVLNNNALVAGDVSDTWVHGDVVSRLLQRCDMRG